MSRSRHDFILKKKKYFHHPITNTFARIHAYGIMVIWEFHDTKERRIKLTCCDLQSLMTVKWDIYFTLSEVRQILNQKKRSKFYCLILFDVIIVSIISFFIFSRVNLRVERENWNRDLFTITISVEIDENSFDPFWYRLLILS